MKERNIFGRAYDTVSNISDKALALWLGSEVGFYITASVVTPEEWHGNLLYITGAGVLSFMGGFGVASLHESRHRGKEEVQQAEIIFSHPNKMEAYLGGNPVYDNLNQEVNGVEEIVEDTNNGKEKKDWCIIPKTMFEYLEKPEYRICSFHLCIHKWFMSII